MDVHDVANNQRPALVAAQHPGREGPDRLKLVGVSGSYLLQL